MELKMNIDGKTLDSIKVHAPTCNNEKYLAWLKDGLRIKHQHLLLQLQTEPFFYLELASIEQE